MSSTSPDVLTNVATDSHVKLEQYYIPVLHDVFFALDAVVAFLSRVSDGTAFHEILPMNGFRLDEAALEVGVDFAGGFRRGITRVNRPGARFLFVEGEKRPQAQQMVRAVNE